MTSPQPKRPYAPRMPPEQRREQLLDAALEIINTGGLGAVSVDAVAKLSNVTRPVVYSQFADASHILRDVLDREAQRALAQITDALPGDLTDADPVETFTTVARGFFAAVLSHPARWQPVLLPSDYLPPAIRKHKERNEAVVHARFADIIQWFLHRDRGDVDVDVDLLAHLFLAGMAEAGRLLLNDPATYPPDRLIDMTRFIAESLLRGHAP